MSDFKPFSKAVHDQFAKMSKNELFVVDVSGDDLYAAYLAAFPEGTNPMFRERTEHDCSCCKNFIRNIGNVVSIVDNQIVTVWDAVTTGDEYEVVATKLSNLVGRAQIKSLFRASEGQYGNERTIELKGDTTRFWNHFVAKVANKHFTKDVGAVVGDYNTTVSVFKRGLDELSQDAFNTVSDLISSNNLYKGNDFKAIIGIFKELQSKYIALDTNGKNRFVWANATSHAARFRNTAIGTLLVDLSEGIDVESAVKSFEAKVAPTNYKRPNAIVTQKMVDDAMKTINDLGLESALERRFAKIEDVSVNDILFVDNNVRGKMKGGIGDLLAASVTSTVVSSDKAQEITIDEFLSNVVPSATSIDVQVKNSQQSNFMSITAPVYPDVAPLFKWNNNFAYSYDGNVTDSIKERVKAAGGNVVGALRVSLAWYNKDDLDIHVVEPGDYEIYFGNRSSLSPKGGKLDVDANGGSGMMDNPVENIAWKNLHDGEYKVVVNNYNKRETNDAGFTLEIEVIGIVQQYSCKSSPSSGKDNHALKFTLKNGLLADVETGSGITGGSFSQEKWNVSTEKFTRVNTLMLSPNYWNNKQIGSKHVFFILEGCYNPVPTRGIYNEFLSSDLEKHRKVFELLGQKTMCEPTDNQLSGVGFTSSRGDSVIVKIDGKKLYNVKF